MKREAHKRHRPPDADGNAAMAGGGTLTARSPAALALPEYSRIGQELANAKPAPGAGQQFPVGVGAIAAKPQPMKITSLAAGVQAQGLAKLLKTAEDLMKEGKVGPALGQYQAAA